MDDSDATQVLEVRVDPPLPCAICTCGQPAMLGIAVPAPGFPGR